MICFKLGGIPGWHLRALLQGFERHYARNASPADHV